MKKSFVALFFSIGIFTSCFPEKLKEQMDTGLRESLEMFADQDFKKAIGFIELHKLRTGDYPENLTDLKYMGAMDSSIFNSVDYIKQDSGYELYLKLKYTDMSGHTGKIVELKYPEGFWIGLGCIKSNVRN